MDNNPNFFNPNYYQNIPNNEVNWAMLAQQWINQNQPRNDQMQSHWGPPVPHRHPQHQSYYGPPRPPQYDPYMQQPPMPRMSAPYHRAPPPPQRMTFFNHDEPPRMPVQAMPPRIPSLMDVNRTRSWDCPPGPPAQMRFSEPPRPLLAQRPSPLFPSAQRTATQQFRNPVDSPYDWPEEPPPPPNPEWISSDVINQDQPVLDTTEKKKLPEWILQGLERMEKEKKLRLEKEEKKKLFEKLEKEREESRVNGKSRFDSDDEDVEEKPKRRFEEYPDRQVLTSTEKEAIKVFVLRKVISSVLLQSTNVIIRKCCEETASHFRAKQTAKVVVNKATAALTALAQLGGDDSSEDEAEIKPTTVTSCLSNDSVDSKKDAKHESRKSRSRSRSPGYHHSVKSNRSRSRSPHRRNSHDDRRRNSRDASHEGGHSNHHRQRADSNGYRRSGYHY